jgi:hypothetical protein
MFAQEIGERLVKQGLNGAVDVCREVLDAAVFLELYDKRQAPFSGHRRGKVLQDGEEHYQTLLQAAPKPHVLG